MQSRLKACTGHILTQRDTATFLNSHTQLSPCSWSPLLPRDRSDIWNKTGRNKKCHKIPNIFQCECIFFENCKEIRNNLLLPSLLPLFMQNFGWHRCSQEREYFRQYKQSETKHVFHPAKASYRCSYSGQVIFIFLTKTMGKFRLLEPAPKEWQSHTPCSLPEVA